ncbi:MAG: TonB-dependent receptor [Rikenellaceae bacterium]|nr:TonB-dependent receptor [Rikenellaceae bacterium]
MKRILSILAFMALTAFSLTAQTVEGHVYDETTREPLIGATVIYIVRGETLGTSTDGTGYYRVDVPDGGANLVFSYLGYEEFHAPVVVGARETLTRDIYMKPEVQLLQNVVVSAGRYEQKLSELTVSMDVLDRNVIARQIPTDLTDVLSKLPSVDVTDNQPSIRGGAGWTYGVGSRALVLVDGMSVLGAANGAIAWNIIPMENIEQVEVLKGASSVLYGSSALNGLINVRTGRPGLVPKTTLKLYAGIYGNPANDDYTWWDKSLWKDGKYEVKPFLRSSVFSGVRNPMYEGIDMSHSRRIGNFDFNLGMNFLTDEGYRDQGYRKRFRLGGNLTYHQPHSEIMNYGVNYNIMTDKYGDFLIWRSVDEPLRASSFTTMGREGNTFNIDPFFNFINTRNNTAHRIKARFQYEGDNIVSGAETSLLDLLENMGTDYQGIIDLAGNFTGDGDLMGWLMPAITSLVEGDLKGVLGWGRDELNKIFPNADTADYMDLIAFLMNNGLPLGDSSELIPWLINSLDPKPAKTHVSKNYTYYLDYQFNKKIGDAQFTVGTTYHHVTNNSVVTGNHQSDNISLFFQYYQTIWNRHTGTLRARAEYYRVDDHKKEAETKMFGVEMPFKPAFRGGLNYQLAEYTFLRGSVGQGYRYPSLVEKYARQDIGGAGVFPNKNLKAETSINAEIGLIQGYKVGPFQGFVDIAGFYTYYKNMIEFRIGFFENYGDYNMIDGIGQLIGAMFSGNGIGLGANFYNVDRARIYGLDISTNGTYNISPGMKFLYNIGYVYTEPIDPDYKKKNEIENAYTDVLQMKEKSNTSKYLKYRQKHTFKGSIDFEWNRLTIGTNFAWKSRTLSVDYIFLDERPRTDGKLEIMDYVRDVLFGHNGTENFASYWKRTNKDYWLWDLRAGVKATDQLNFQVSVHNVMNKEYSVRPMALGQPRTYVFTVGYTF